MEGIRPRSIVFSSATSMFSTLFQGVGVAICPEALASEALETGQLVRLDWAPAPDETTLFMIRHADKWCSPATARFIQITEEVVASARG